jgi:5-methylcytosine-specific restriction endonuclease McrA
MRFGRLVGLRELGQRAARGWLWRFKCDCGSEADLVAVDIAARKNASCGCGMREYYRSRMTSKSCGHCGGEFEVLKGKASKRTYCSDACCSAGLRQKHSGVGNPAYVDGTARAPEKKRLRMRIYKRANPEKVAAWNGATRAKRKAVAGRYRGQDVQRLRHRQSHRCAICSTCIRQFWHVDHIIPIARGGSNFVGNLQLLCAACNLSKRDLLPVEFRRFRMRKYAAI